MVSEAYGQLASEGYLSVRQGAPVRVAASVQRQRPREPARSLLPRFAYDLRPGPDLSAFPRDAWLRSLRAAWRAAPFDALGEPDPRGVPELREALAEQLARARGAATDPEHVLVCPGFRAGFSALCRWLAERGAGTVAVEDPGWHPARLVLEQAGLEVLPVPVDEHGLRVDALGDAQVVLVTPAHQFPTGVALSPERRAALVEWAADGERLIVEDDYDGERGVLQGLAPERVVLIGSLSKRLAPGLRLGWMLTPSWLTWALTPALAIEAGGARRARPARAARLPRPRRARPPRAPDARPLRRAPRARPARVPPRHGRAGSSSPRTWTTSRRRSPAPPSAASGSRAWSCTATSRPGRAGSCSGWRSPEPALARALELAVPASVDLIGLRPATHRSRDEIPPARQSLCA